MPRNSRLNGQRLRGGFAQNPIGLPLLLDVEQGDAGGTTGGGTGTVAPPANAPTGGGNEPASPTRQNLAATPEDVQREYGPLLDAIDNRVDQALTPLREQNDELRGRVEQLSQPIHDGGAIFQGNGRAPYGSVGPLLGQEEDRRGYQFYRAYGYMHRHDSMNEDNCKVELAVSEKLRKFYVEQNGLETVGVRGSLLVPYGSAMICEFEEGLGEQIAGLCRQGIAGADLDEFSSHVRQSYGGASVKQALSTFDETALGIFTDAGIAGEMFDLVRAREVFSRVGATQLTLPPNGFMKFARQTGAATGYWVGESAAITASQQASGSLELRAKKAAAKVTLPNELLRFGTPSVEAFVRQDIARVLSLLADLAMLEGLGGTSIKGIINYANILTHTAGTVATNGNTFAPEDPAGMLSDVEEVDHDPEADGFAYVMRPKMWKNIRTRRSGLLDSTDAKVEGIGEWLFDINRGAIQNGQPIALEGQPVVKSSQVSNTHVKGSGTNLTYVLAGVFRHWLIANAGVMEFAMSTQGDTDFTNDQSSLRAIRHVDAAPRYENAFVLTDSIDMDLPA